mgnify:CR=1 FL=1
MTHLDDVFVLFLERAVEAGLGVGVFHPVDGVQVTEAAVEGLAVDHVVGRAVSTPARLLSVGCGGREDIDVGGEQALEHRSRLARLHVEHELLVHLVVVHGLEPVVEVLGVEEVTVGELDDASTSVVDEVDEDLVVGATLEDLAAGLFGVASDDVKEELGGDNGALVVHLASVVHIDARGALGGGLVEQLARERVFLVVGDVVLHHEDDVALGHATGLDNLVCVAGVGLVAVVAVSL